MKTEDLKQLAEYMGWLDVHIQHLNGLYVVLGVPVGCSAQEEYSPLTNAEQCLELMERFKMSASHLDNGGWVTYIGTDDAGLGFPTATAKGKTINEAVTLAAIAAIRGETNGT